MADLGEAAQAVVKRLADERLLVTAPVAGSASDETVEVSHEALIRHWERLRSWVNLDREFLLWRERFGGFLAEWRQRARHPGALLPPALLLEAERWLGERGDKLSADERGYIEQGKAVRERERHAEAERLRLAQERREREIRAQSVKRTLVLALGLLLLTILTTLGVSAVRRESIRRSLASHVGWVRIVSPAGGDFPIGCVPGDQQCGQNEKRHSAKLPRAFDMMSHEAAVAQFRRFVDAQSTITGRLLAPRGVSMDGLPGWSQDDHPVVYVSWDDAREFCAFVGGRLPTEAEWEYSARGGNAEWIYPWGNEYSADLANGLGVHGADKWPESSPVGSFPPNRYGLYDMISNVWEWTSTVYRDDSSEGGVALEDETSREARVTRGGSWSFNPSILRVSFRGSASPPGRNGNLGFRCARDVSS